MLEIEVVGRKVNLVGNATSASEGRVSFREIEQRPLLRAGDVLETCLLYTSPSPRDS